MRIFISLIVLTLTGTVKADLLPADRAGLVDRLAKLQNMAVACDVHDNFLPLHLSTSQPAVQNNPDITRMRKLVVQATVGEFDSQENFYFLNGSARYEKELRRGPVKMLGNVSKSIKVFTPERFERLFYYSTKAHQLERIADQCTHKSRAMMGTEVWHGSLLFGPARTDFANL